MFIYLFFFLVRVMHTEAKGQLAGVDLLFLSCGSWTLKSDGQAW